MKKSDIGIYGLGLMGRNIALNFNDSGFYTSVFNPHLPGEERRVESFISVEAADTNIRGFDDLETFIDSLEKPRKIMLMIKTGDPVDAVLEELAPLLDRQDILIDGGNSHYRATNRRLKHLSKLNIRYVGMGISGGKEGTRKGPALMPGGDNKAWAELQPLLQPIAATSADGTPCCKWMGAEGAGHFVKMVHNGIEYALMQLIGECYHLMKAGMDMSNPEIGRAFESWNTDLLSSYLLDITTDILAAEDKEGQFILDHILDKAEQRGSGRWAVLTALDLGLPVPVISEAVFSRNMSAFKNLREEASEELDMKSDINLTPESTENLQKALMGGHLIAFAEGFWILQAANEEFDWDIPLDKVAKVWRGGCIIRSAIVNHIAESYQDNEQLSHLLLASDFKTMLHNIHDGWRSATAFGIRAEIPVPAMSAALSHFDALRTGRLPANLIQAQRDYFGAHQYERTDRPGGQLFHTNWKSKT